MVRTRNTRNSSGGGGGGGGSRDNSASFKPLTSGAKKSRKRQLTDPASSSTSSALVPGPGSSTALALLGPGTSHHGHRQQEADSVRSVRSDHHEEMEEGYLAPAPASASFNNNQANNIQVAAWLEDSPETDPELLERVESPLSTSPEDDIVHSAASDLVMHAPTAHAQSAVSTLTPGLVSVAPGGHHSLAMAVSSGRVTLLPEDLKSNLECPVCARLSLPPIMQCRNGHVTCNPCRLKVQSCPMCREVDIDIRWVTMTLFLMYCECNVFL